MEYISTRGGAKSVSSAAAILGGIAPDGGLFVPAQLPVCGAKAFYGLPYAQAAQKVLQLFLTDYDPQFLQKAARDTYEGENFSQKAGAVERVADGLYSLELWHGPTCAFKDYALQLMPKLLCEAKTMQDDTGVTKILVATSGDTGKAALAGYAGLPGIRIAVFYPDHGTSEVQRLQMATQEGENVAVYAVNGNFDDAQTGVKRVFADKALAQKLAAKGEALSSANSINWGRLVPQIVYYFYSYAQLVEKGFVKDGEPVDYCVPTGNFGDILAGYYARRMGLPVGRLICASNKNNVLSDFLATGTYDARRAFYKTASPSMDILVSSNLERLLYHVSGDGAAVARWMDELSKNGVYTVAQEVLFAIREVFTGGCASDEAAGAELHRQFEENKYLCDPHTAVAFSVARTLRGENPCVVVSTANPYKFPCDVLAALGGGVPDDEFAAMRALEQKTGVSAPQSLAGLRQKPVRFETVIEKAGIGAAALSL